MSGTRPDFGHLAVGHLPNQTVAAGHTNAQIARRLDVTEKTVSEHPENIYTRLQVSSRTAAVTRAFPHAATEAAAAHGES